MPKIPEETGTITTITVAKDENASPLDYQLLSEKELLVLAYDGDKEAAYQLGMLYDYGTRGAEQSFSKALSWYQAADAANYPKAACALGYMYLNGCGVTQNIDVAEQYFNRAVAFTDMEGYVGLGRVALARDPVDGEKALDLFNQANRAGIVDGIYFVGYLAEKGIGLPEPNYPRALALYQRILNRYDTDEKLRVPDTYAFDNACVRLGIMYMEGLGVEKNYGTAREYFTRAANNGYAMAQYYMGIVYESGRGVPKNYDEALRWFNLAADQDYAPAINQIGYMYFVGEGVEANFEQAVYYQKLAAALGSVKAQVNLGYLYENGFGVVQDFDSALTYYRMAQTSGYEGAPEAILRVTNALEAKKASVEDIPEGVEAGVLPADDLSVE
ncbi:MAG: sel1 repeat family protein [Lachnospiraceae bacterium]|nr:sel1 repeat family protein [Lachnospiraceae bacterium]